MKTEQNPLDSLTQAFSRSEFLRYLDVLKAEYETKHQGFCLAYFDIDHLKKYNAHNGHSRGDGVLKKFVQIVKNQSKSTDRIFRVQGDEFVLVRADAKSEQILSLAQAVCQISQTELPRFQSDHCGDKNCSGAVPVSVTVGLVQFSTGMRIVDFLKEAKDKVQRGKELGKNRVVF